jgi:DNA-3-methyladenine glycosylase II
MSNLRFRRLREPEPMAPQAKRLKTDRVQVPNPSEPVQGSSHSKLLLGCSPANNDVLPTSAPAPSGLTIETLTAACEFLRQADPRLAPLIDIDQPPVRLLSKPGSCFGSLAKSIVFQQLATKAAAAIYARVLTAAGCEETLTPEAILAAPVQDLRGAGLSQQKVDYLLDLSSHFSDGRLSDKGIVAIADPEALRSRLCAVKGIGPWSVDMFTMFHLGAPDVLPTGDLGVRKGMQELYGLKELPGPAAMAEVAAAWAPYKSVGSYYMWRVEVKKAAAKGKGKRGVR